MYIFFASFYLRNTFIYYYFFNAARVRILKTSLSDEQMILRALHVCFLTQAQREAFDEPDGTIFGVGTADASAEAFIAFAPLQTAN